MGDPWQMKVWFGVAIFIVIGFLIVGGISAFLMYSENRFCQKVHPSSDGYYSPFFGSGTPTTFEVEPGFIQCCRPIYIEHIEQGDCKIFEYEK